MELEQAMTKRRSVRKYEKKEIEQQQIEKILEAGAKAPSGKNGQPWKFIVVQKDKKLLKKISALTLYDNFVKTADCLIVVLLDKTQSYHYIKDCQAIGACIQNMLLTIVDLGLGACWIGEILNRDLFVREELGLDKSLDLMAVLSVGYPKEEKTQRKRRWQDSVSAWH